MWRHHHYQAIVAAYESQAQHEPVSIHSLIFFSGQLMHSYLPFWSVNKHLSPFPVGKYALTFLSECIGIILSGY